MSDDELARMFNRIFLNQIAIMSVLSEIKPGILISTNLPEAIQNTKNIKRILRCIDDDEF